MQNTPPPGAEDPQRKIARILWGGGGEWPFGKCRLARTLARNGNRFFEKLIRRFKICDPGNQRPSIASLVIRSGANPKTQRRSEKSNAEHGFHWEK